MAETEKASGNTEASAPKQIQTYGFIDAGALTRCLIRMGILPETMYQELVYESVAGGGFAVGTLLKAPEGTKV